MASTLPLGHCRLYVKKLNNSAAMCIDIGHYDRAIKSLKKALQLSSKNSDEKLSAFSTCHQYSLDSCIAFSGNNHPLLQTVMTPNSRVFENGYVYQRPIRIPHKVIYENHNMGNTLFLIITFNLALAHHLSVMVPSRNISCNFTTTSNITPATIPRDHIQKKINIALQLYELCQNWYSSLARQTSHKSNNSLPNYNYSSHYLLSSNSGVGSIRFAMIVSNNLGHTHLLVNNYTKHRQYLEQLLSVVMLAAEYKTRSCNDVVMDDLSSSSSNHEDLWKTDLDGFLMNVSSLFSQGRCAEAA
mmetsp:Transcript_3132/g.6766  ORF Transcript_3132/g.6766 Transcript_3132/m.6766 type:complete len:300 (-) Transcript_3132:456-1355(-)